MLSASRAALAVMATATAHLAAGSAASTPMIMKVSSAAVPTHPAVPARPMGRYRVLRAANASSATTATSATPGTRSAAMGTGQVHARLMISATAQHDPTSGPVTSIRRAARRAGCARANSAAIRLRIAELGHGGCCRRVGSQAQAQVPPVGFLEAIDKLLHHRPGQLTGQRVEIAGDQAGSGHGASTRPFTSSALIRSNATLTLPSRQYTRYPDSYM